MKLWEFWIDVGGTFTDCIACAPNGDLIPTKVLSSAVTKGRLERQDTVERILDPARCADPPGFWVGYPIRFLAEEGTVIHETHVAAFDASSGQFVLDEHLLTSFPAGTSYELASPEEAPILAIRRTLALQLDQPIPEIVVRLGTTRGTNALLTRTGARTVLVTTRGFADVPLIGNQDRPRLFDLVIQKPQPLFERVIEVDERIDAEGQVLECPPLDRVREELQAARAAGSESVAICLLHSFANPQHELQIEQTAREAGFEEISRSSQLSPLIKIVSRGDTTLVDAYLNPVLRQYVQRLRESLGNSSLKIMTSAGGLVGADRFVGKDSILSGPAGGVISFSRMVRRYEYAENAMLPWIVKLFRESQLDEESSFNESFK